MKIGFMEFVVIFLIIFLVLGPRKTVLYARKLGKWLQIFRAYISSFTSEFQETVAEPLQEMAEPLKEMAKPLAETAEAVQAPVRELKKDLNDAVNGTAEAVRKATAIPPVTAPAAKQAVSAKQTDAAPPAPASEEPEFAEPDPDPEG